MDKRAHVVRNLLPYALGLIAVALSVGAAAEILLYIVVNCLLS